MWPSYSFWCLPGHFKLQQFQVDGPKSMSNVNLTLKWLSLVYLIQFAYSSTKMYSHVTQYKIKFKNLLYKVIYQLFDLIL